MTISLRNFYQSITTKLRGLTNRNFTEKKYSLYSIVFLSIMFFFVWTLFYALIVYEQFSWSQILGTASVFVVILSLFSYFFTDLFKENLMINFKNTSFALLVFILMVLLFSTMYQSSYRLTFPLLETELNLGWHQDTAYHIAMIQSILNFGYPSIAQNGVPFNFYHVMSHYVDALIIWITQVEPYDSYMLLVTFKKWLIVSSLALFIAFFMKKMPLIIFIFIFILLAPIFTGSWHIIASHALWFTTIIVIFSSIKIFNLFMVEELKNRDYFYIFMIIVLVALGKISTGFMYASLVGCFILIKYPKDKRVYFLGTVLIIFFWMYSKLFAAGYTGDTSNSYDFSILTYSYYWNTIISPVLEQFKAIPSQNTMIHIDIAILTALAFLFKDRNTLKFLFATIASYFLLVSLSGITVRLNFNDILFFYLGFTCVLNLFIFMFIVRNLQDNKVFDGVEYTNFYTTLLLISTIYISSFYVSAVFPKSFNEMESRLKYINNGPFVNINKKLPSDNKLSVSKLLTNRVKNTAFADFERPLYNFREKINQILIDNKVSKTEALLFVPREIFMEDISRFGGVEWGRGMMIYAITGVPMLNGIYDNKRKSYSHQYYTKEALWKKSNFFSFTDACMGNSTKLIIETVDFNKLKFNIHRCK
ncbi:MAG: hypothetical protein RBR54_04400 [Sulfurimonas sp.]|jgi:hypothetical protein|nr:hypothetical protein [Sulfurimonas sp.]